METRKNQYAVVTGGTSGIGYELAKRLARDGHNLVIVARTQADLDRVAKEIREQYGVTVLTISKDLFNRENAFALHEEIRKQNISVDILVNDAGQGAYGKFVDTDIRSELAIIDLNVCSLVILTKLFLRDMVARGHGRILNVSSIASKAPGPWHAVYHGTKAFVQTFTEGIRSELKDTGVTVTALLPGPTDTDFFRKAGMTRSKIAQEDKLYDAEGVATDGYEALMRGDDMVVSGFKNKAQVAMGNVMPDSMAAEQMKKQQQPAETHREK